MPWLDNERDTATATDNVWLKFPQLKNVGEKAEIRMRVLGGDSDRPEEPAGVWVHWFQARPYNCCGQGCPVCEVRNRARITSPDTIRDEYPLRHKYYFNVLVTEEGQPVVRVFGFSTGLGKQLQSFAERYGPLTSYDLTVRKTQVGRLAMNVEYNPFYDGPRELSPAERAAAKDVHDLSQFTKPAPIEALRAIARGEAPDQAENDQGRLLGQIRNLIPADVDVAHFGIDANTPMPKLEALLQSLRG